MTDPAGPRSRPVTDRLRSLLRASLPVVLLGLVAVVLAACVGPTGATSGPDGSGIASATASPTPQPPLLPAPLNPDPGSVLAWVYTPVFQALLLLLVGIYKVVGDIGLAIIVMTLIVRTAMVPLVRRQMVSMRQMQAIQPEIQEIGRRYKGDRLKQQQAQSELMRERGISQAGCLVGLLPLLLLIPMYTVIRDGLQNWNPQAMMDVFGARIFDLGCPTVPPPPGVIQPCLDTKVAWLGGVDASQPWVLNFPGTAFGISVLAVVYVIFSLIASRMAIPPHDPNKPLDQAARTQRQTMLLMPVIFLVFGNSIPVGLYIYLLVSTIYQLVQQFLTTGWGSMFPLFGWSPAFARDHKPRFPVAIPKAAAPSSRTAGAPARPTPQKSAIERAASANATIRQRGRQGRRGRRR
jgi:YidC/Oxa1 family membrane protein insertase